MKIPKALFKKYWYIICVGILTAIGFYLRTKNLGRLSLYASDEGVIALAVRGILETGRPFLPMHEIYPRSPLTLYLMAFASKLFGFNDCSLRSIGVIFSVLTVPLSYLFVRDIFKDKLAGLLTAGILAFSAWHIELARQIKIYAPFSFFYLLSVYIFLKGFFHNEKIYRPLFLFSYLAAMFTNILAVTLVVLFGLYAASKKRLRDLNRSEWGYLAFTITAFLIWAAYSSFLMHKLPHMPKSEAAGLLGYTNTILPNARLLIDLLKHPAPIFYIGLLALFFIGVVYMPKNIWCMAVITFAALGQIVLAGLFFAGYLFFTSSGISFKDRKFRVPLATIACFFIFWILYGLLGYSDIAQMNAGILARTKEVLRQLVVYNYPHTVYLYLISLMFPVMAFFALPGLILLFNKSCEDRLHTSYILAWGMLLIPMLIIGGSVAETHVESRHISNLFPFFVMIYVYSLTMISGYFGKRYRTLILLLFLFLTVEHSGPKEAFAISQRRHGDKIHPMFALSSKQYIQMDFKGASQFVKDRLKETDIIVYAGFPPNLFFYYIERVDYALRPGDKSYNESLGYTTTAYIILPEFEKLVSLKKQRIWLIVKKDELTLAGRGSKDLVDKILKEYAKRQVFTSSDNNFSVHLFETS